MLKSILVPVRGDGMVATVLAHAAELAKQHGAQVNVVHCRAQAKDLIPQGIPLNDFAKKVMMEQRSNWPTAKKTICVVSCAVWPMISA